MKSLEVLGVSELNHQEQSKIDGGGLLGILGVVWIAGMLVGGYLAGRAYANNYNEKTHGSGGGAGIALESNVKIN